MSKLRLMSHNQWDCTKNRAEWEALGLDCSAEARMRGNVRVLQELLPDIVGGQEVNKTMQIYLKLYCLEAGLPYTIIWGNQTPLIYRADKFELLDTLNIGVFRDKADGKVFIFATTHLWWKKENAQPGSDEARRRQLKEAIEKIDAYQKKYGDCPVILVGDLNANYTSPAIKYALGEGGYTHAHDVATDFRHEGRGYNACGPKAPGCWQDAPFETAIDHILVKDIPEGSVKRFDRYCPDYYLTVSDHAPTYIDIVL